ncbi:MAG: putative ABC transport system ATP-binding protein [Pseudophaeobacter arcticus]|jgi:putative ABC transport system ATP-binding protein
MAIWLLITQPFLLLNRFIASQSDLAQIFEKTPIFISQGFHIHISNIPKLKQSAPTRQRAAGQFPPRGIHCQSAINLPFALLTATSRDTDQNMVLTVTDVTKTIPQSDLEKPILDRVSLQLQAGTSLALTGESGSGKSTLLHLVGALDGFDSGEIHVDGVALRTLDDSGRAALRRSKVSIVFQQFNIIPSLDVAANIALHAKLAKAHDPDWEALLAQRLGLTALLSRYPEQLSGGQQQRVAIARALAMRPKLLLADEPTGSLDEESGEAVLALMLDLVAESQTALFLVTHSQTIAAALDRRLHLSNGGLT